MKGNAYAIINIQKDLIKTPAKGCATRALHAGAQSKGVPNRIF